MTYLFRTHYSTGKGIIQVNDSTEEPGQLNLVDLCKKHCIKQCFVVDTTMAGILPIYNTLDSNGISLVFGLELGFVDNAEDCGEESNLSLHNNIIFVRNKEGYKRLIQISSKANTDFYHNCSRIDYNYYYSVADFNLVLAVPFYNGFIAKNSLTSGQCVPDYKGTKPAMFIEDNSLPFDAPLRELTKRYAEDNGHEVLETQTVLYEKTEDCLAYMARRCMSRKNGKQRTLEKPELPHFGSDQFCIIK